MTARRRARGRGADAPADSWRGVGSERTEDDRQASDGLATFLRRRSRALLGSLLRPERKPIAVGSTLVVVNALAGMAGPLLVKFGIDVGIEPLLAGGAREGGSLAALYLVVAVYAVVQLCDVFTLRAYLRITGLVGERVLFDLRTRTHAKFQKLSVAFHERYTSGRVISRLTSDVEALAELLSTGFVRLPTAVLQLVGISAVMLVLDVTMAATVLVVFPLVFGLTWWFRNRSERVYRRVREAIALVIIHFAESLGGIRAVQAYRREPQNQERFELLNDRYRAANLDSISLASRYGPGITLLGDIAILGVMVFGGYRTVQGAMEVGTLVAFLLYLRQFFQPMQELSQVYNVFQAAAAALENLSGVLEEAPDVAEPEPERAVEGRAWRGELAFSDVHFAYKTTEVLHGIDLHIPAGQTVALVGQTGAGKSTIARLVSRFYDPTSGRISIDGVDLRDLTATELRKAVVMVTQEGFLFTGTVADNIAFGRPDATREQIVAAARHVGADGFISALPDGYDTDVRKRGGRLSAGQKQLVALARAFIADPHVIIFDEATSSIDMPSERQIQHALELVLRDRTAFLIAHRLATVEIADRVLVVDDGRIIEDGSPADLLAGGGRWAALSNAWEESLA